MTNVNSIQEKDGMGKPLTIILIIVGVLAIGAAGYLIGKNMAEEDAKTAYDQQVASLQQQVNDAKADATPKIEGAADTVEELQVQNASLTTTVNEQKATIDQQTQKIADLEKQLEEANATTPPPTTE